MNRFTLEPAKYSQMFDFHSAPNRPMESSDGAIVFGRKDALVGEAAARLLL